MVYIDNIFLYIINNLKMQVNNQHSQVLFFCTHPAIQVCYLGSNAGWVQKNETHHSSVFGGFRCSTPTLQFR